MKCKNSNQNINKVLVVFGTRPEAIKMCPLVKELYTRENLKTIVCVTGQHKEMLEQVLNEFEIIPDYYLNIMKQQQTLFDITESMLIKFREILKEVAPSVCLVHGDTTTAFSAALSCFYMNVPVGHVEAGLRTYRIDSPYPEEFNRQSIDIIAKWLFAPTKTAAMHLSKEGKNKDDIFVTGNTGIDALRYTFKEKYSNDVLSWAEGSRLIILTAHRRENLGEAMSSMFSAIRKIVEEFDDIKVVYPVHSNPLVMKIAKKYLSHHKRIRLINPLPPIEFHNLLAHCYLVLTDSGGIQEEAPYFGKPVLVMRNTTERPEGVEAGTLKLVGTNEDTICRNVRQLLTNREEYLRMSRSRNPYGDGYASKRIADILERVFTENGK